MGTPPWMKKKEYTDNVAVETKNNYGASCSLCNDSLDQIVHELTGVTNVQIRICPTCLKEINRKV